MAHQSPAAIFDAFINGRLTKGEWTHEAHLITCVVALVDRTPSQAVAFLRDAIQTHNCGIGIANTETSGYHETITRYYVTAVHEAIGGDLAATQAAIEDRVAIALADEFCDRRAPLKFWSDQLLFSTPARLGWVEPDLAPPPWPITGDDLDHR